MSIDVTTPALLFPAISLLLLAYTNRFLALAALIRQLYDRYQAHSDGVLLAQIQQLRRRVWLIRSMQSLGVLSLLLCVAAMFALFSGELLLGKLVFGLSLLMLMGSLGFSIWEIYISVEALNLQLGALGRTSKEK